MRIKDAIDQYQAIVYEKALGDNVVSLQARKDLSQLSTFLTKELGSNAVSKLQNEMLILAKNETKK
tara:strand:+ start:791 stop:988 length:198 start_codon:yes stop_codon:yes gene_type:complete